ncbi:similar to Saccharomyces cerevisiae YNL036W NCE103 Carbonic anhydrase [Maudiozyma barnettii]|uniref:Carbonic anhydrase n=1 Tax=Maudiozyma barnettii TaxID=61262 RepID=A0A8H2VCT6_9SACH|nr:carbonate dehydratase NCE103 [Kazachstania barnettii]CAB4252863.1 similar to Saccharomyces cerevisiae YNL036W NCE103 Carbonic anhydrase [Kazachstania barnettii]CAD1780658.1 similar to Saccharomyces cerevisiae YNL036W NCE103 Carbonic anhydrase [Kazachstania barnettii]
MGTDILTTIEPSYSSTNLLVANKEWADSMKTNNPAMFTPFATTNHTPHTLFFGCSDARYNESCLGYATGEVFTFKTIANIVLENDLSAQSALEYAVNVLNVKQIVICGHTDCGGINTCLLNRRNGLKDSSCSHLYSYLQDIEDLRDDFDGPSLHKDISITKQAKLLAYRNVRKQAQKIGEKDFIKKAMQDGGLRIHGLLYNLDSGLLEKVEIR